MNPTEWARERAAMIAATPLSPEPKPEKNTPMPRLTDNQIGHMVDRFLSWRLPENFRPDGGIQFDADAAKKLNPRNHRYEPNGTNLFDATQAAAMVRHMIDGLPEPKPPKPLTFPEAIAELERVAMLFDPANGNQGQYYRTSEAIRAVLGALQTKGAQHG